MTQDEMHDARELADEVIAEVDLGGAWPIMSGSHESGRAIWTSKGGEIDKFAHLPFANMDAIGEWIQAATHSAEPMARHIIALLGQVEVLRADMVELARSNLELRRKAIRYRP